MNSLRAALRRVEPCILQVAVTGEIAGKQFRSAVGTGFFVSGEQIVATAAHVIVGPQESLAAKGAANITFFINVPAGDSVGPNWAIRQAFFGVPAEVIELDRGNDLAVLRAQTRIGKAGLSLKVGENTTVDVSDAQFSTARLEIGDEIAVAGFPLSLPYLVVQRGIVSAIPILPVFGTPHESQEIVMDARVNPGNSGGPVFLASNGLLVGVCRAQRLTPVLEEGEPHNKLTQSAGLGIATPASQLMAILQKHKIPYRAK